MKYALGYSWNSEELFENFKSDKLIIDSYTLEKLYKNDHKKRVAARLFIYCIKLVIEDIIENDVEFVLPTNKRPCSIMMRTVKDEAFRNARRKHKFMDVDFLQSNFKANEISFIMHGYNRTVRYKPIYLSKSCKQRILDYTNQNKIYCGYNKKTVKDYYQAVKDAFPIFPMHDIKLILNYAWRALYLINSYGGDFLYNDNKFFFYIGYMHHDSLIHYRYYINKLRGKVRVLYNRKKEKWTGYYYFALTKDQYENYLKQKKKTGRPKKHFKFGHVVFFKIFEDCNLANYGNQYFFKISYPVDMGLNFSTENLVTDKAEFYLERPPMTLKDVINYKSEIIC